MGWLYAHLGRYDQALEHCGQALTLHRESGNRGGVADTLDSLGFAYLCLGDLARARARYQQAIALLDAVPHPLADDIRARVAGLDDHPAESAPLPAAPATAR